MLRLFTFAFWLSSVAFCSFAELKSCKTLQIDMRCRSVCLYFLSKYSYFFYIPFNHHYWSNFNPVYKRCKDVCESNLVNSVWFVATRQQYNVVSTYVPLMRMKKSVFVDMNDNMCFHRKKERNLNNRPAKIIVFKTKDAPFSKDLDLRMTLEFFFSLCSVYNNFDCLSG